MHIISRKYDTLLESLLGITNSEKITSQIVSEIYSIKKVFRPNAYYLGNYLLKGHHLMLVLDTNGTYIICLKQNTFEYTIYDLADVVDYTISYISVKDFISIVGNGRYDRIYLEKDKEIKFIWK